MQVVGACVFPETREEVNQWRPVVHRVALNRDVLVVAKTRMEGAWSAYCAAVPGRNHDDEQDYVLKSGSKLYEDFARVMFPQFADLPYAQ
jgi:hypothetical protein